MRWAALYMQINTPRLSGWTLACVGLAILMLPAGCAMHPTWDATATTADGVVVDVPVASFKTDVTDDVVEVVKLQFLPLTGKDGNKRLAVIFEAVFHGGTKPTSIVITDVTEAPILQVFGDYSPKLAANSHWTGATEPLNPTNNLLKFLTNIDNSIRIYRFTVKLTDGTTHVLNVPILVPGFYKEFMYKEAGGGTSEPPATP
jgi:hypothetical protein